MTVADLIALLSATLDGDALALAQLHDLLEEVGQTKLGVRLERIVRTREFVLARYEETGQANDEFLAQNQEPDQGPDVEDLAQAACNAGMMIAYKSVLKVLGENPS